MDPQKRATVIGDTSDKSYIQDLGVPGFQTNTCAIAKQPWVKSAGVMHELYIVYVSLEYDWYWTEMHRTHTQKKTVHQPIHHGMDIWKCNVCIVGCVFLDEALDCWVKSTISGSVFYHVLYIQNGGPIWYPPWLSRFNFYMSTWHEILIPAVARTRAREISSCEIHWNRIPTVSYLGGHRTKPM